MVPDNQTLLYKNRCNMLNMSGVESNVDTFVQGNEPDGLACCPCPLAGTGPIHKINNW